MMDVIASYRTARMIYRVRFNDEERKGLPEALTVMNRVQSRTRLARTAATAILNYGFPAAPVALQLRQAYADACGRGSVVWRMGAPARDAANEIAELFEYVLDPQRATGVVSENLRAVERADQAVVLKERVLPAGELIANFDKHPSEQFSESSERQAAELGTLEG